MFAPTVSAIIAQRAAELRSQPYLAGRATFLAALVALGPPAIGSDRSGLHKH